eukprot:124324-Prymnesium_polylepis.1
MLRLRHRCVPHASPHAPAKWVAALSGNNRSARVDLLLLLLAMCAWVTRTAATRVRPRARLNAVPWA